MNTEIIEGSKVVYNKPLKGLPENSIGIVVSVYMDKATISYPQYAPVEDNGKWKYSDYVYSHSALLTDLKVPNTIKQ